MAPQTTKPQNPNNDDLNSVFKPGTEVEISSNDNGFRGAWYVGTVINPKTTKNNKQLIQVEYKTLMADESGTKRLRETLDVVQLRPIPPREKRDRDFKFSDEVDAYYNDGWWEGVITALIPGNRYSVFFRATREQLEFSGTELRVHREWFHGKWVPPLLEPEAEASISLDLNVRDKNKFTKGATVEICSDEDGFYGAWFSATVLEQPSPGTFKIEYKSLRNDDDTALLTEIVDANHIRPCPPLENTDHFRLFEEVDALYNEGWWVGVVSKVLSRNKYEVFFRGTEELLVFKQSDLRRHLEWINGKWVSSSAVCNLLHR